MPSHRRYRERLLPQLMAGLLPAAGILGSYLATTFSASDTAAGRWVLEAVQVRTSFRACIRPWHTLCLHLLRLCDAAA